MREVIIGLIQLENELGDKEHNLEKAVSLIGEAAKKGAGIICLPELFVTGYHLEALKDDLYDMAERPDGAVFARLCGVARQMKSWLQAPVPRRAEAGFPPSHMQCSFPRLQSDARPA